MAETTASEPGAEGFYVTVRRDSRTGFLLGPHDSKEAAEQRVPAGRKLAELVDPFTAFDGFGVTRVVMQPGADLPPGKLNHLLPERPCTIWQDGELYGDYHTAEERDTSLAEARAIGGEIELSEWDLYRPGGPGWNDRYSADREAG